MPQRVIQRRFWQHRGRLIVIHCPECEQHTSFDTADVDDETGKVRQAISCLRCGETYNITLQDWFPQGS
jgi:ribosomal protein S27E